MPTGSALMQGAGGLAGRRADAAGEFREIVGRMQDFQRFLPVAVEHQIVPVRNDVVDRAAVGAEGNAAIHAARTLRPGLLLVQGGDEFLVVLQANSDRLVGLLDPVKFEKSGGLAHYAISFSAVAAISSRARRYSCG